MIIGAVGGAHNPGWNRSPRPLKHTEVMVREATPIAAVPVKRTGSIHANTRTSPSRIVAVLSGEDVRAATVVFALTRLLFVVLTYFGVILFNSVLHGPHPSFAHALLPAWDRRWDTAWYIDISQRGYAWHKAVGTSPTAFFPLYPLLIHLGVTLTHRSAIVVALLISNLSFFVGLIYLYRLTAWELGHEVAKRTLIYIAVFPTALFFFAGYTESLFLLLTVACFYHLRRRQWLLAAAFAAFASATRVTGVLLLLPYIYEYARYCNFSPRQMVGRGLAGVALVPAGLFAFMVYLHVTVHDWLAFSHFQAAWQKILTPWLWTGLMESIRQILFVQPSASFFEAHNVLNLAIGIAALAATVAASRRLPAAYSLYLVAFWLVTLSSPAIAGGYAVPWISLSRYIVVLFPLFMYLGIEAQRRGLHDVYLVLSTGMLAVLTVQFINGGWVI